MARKGRHRGLPLVRKADTYYFRHSLPQSARKVFGKKEFIKTLQVSKKSDAVRLARELKIEFDSIMKKSERSPLITWQQIRLAVDEAFAIIYKKYVDSVETVDPSYNDEFSSLNYIPHEYEQYLVIDGSTVDWKAVPELQELTDKIIEWKRIQLPKDSEEYNLFCFKTAQMLKEHDHRKEIFRRYPEINYQRIQPVLEKEKPKNVTFIKELFDQFWKENTGEGGWSARTKSEYEGVYRNIFAILEVSSNKSMNLSQKT